jgi:Peptidase family M28
VDCAQLFTYLLPTKFNNSRIGAAKLMTSNKRRTFSILFLLITVIAVSILMQSRVASGINCVQDSRPSLSAMERAATAQVKLETIKEVVTTLSAKDMEGRGAAQGGGERAAQYLAEKFAKAGLKRPGGDSYQQKIRVEVQTLMPGTQLKVGSNTFQFKKDFGVAQPAYTELKEVVRKLTFVGYGVVSSDLKRDDLAGVDVKDRIVMLLSGKPKGVDARLWQKEAAQRVVFGRLIKKGAAGFIVTYDGDSSHFPIAAAAISNRTVSLAEPIQGTTLPARWSLELLADEFKLPPSVLISDSAANKIFEGQSESFAEIKRKAELGQFVSRNLDENASISPRVNHEKGTTSNVIGVIEGSDPKLKNEALVYTAHYDAFGVDTEGNIYQGASDNALGVGKLVALAEAFVKLKPGPRRSVIFIATTGEEYGDLGAEYWLQHPTFPIERIAADLNFDGSVLEVWGKLAFLLDLGFDLSDLNEVVKSVAAASDVEIYPDPVPDEGFFYRSDHYAFIRRGIPAIFFLGGPAMNPNVLFARAREWQETRYHTPADVIEANWDWEGARMLASFALVTGMRIADQERMPNWKPGSPYKRLNP